MTLLYSLNLSYVSFKEKKELSSFWYLQPIKMALWLVECLESWCKLARNLHGLGFRTKQNIFYKKIRNTNNKKSWQPQKDISKKLYFISRHGKLKLNIIIGDHAASFCLIVPEKGSLNIWVFFGFWLRKCISSP